MSKKEDIAKCSKCGCKSIVEYITKGISQKVWYNEEGFITKEETIYEPTLKHSTYYCSKCNPEK